jgi:hypothetical protein
VPWFKIDDSAHNHPKFRAAGNAAIGLWTRCGSFAANHLTEGIVSGELAREYGTPVQIAKLVKVGLWHESGHDCPRCPQPTAGDYVMHDYFEAGRNSTKEQVEADRAAAAERQRRRREKQKETGSAEKPVPNRSRIGAESEPIRPPVSAETAGQGHVSRRESHDPCQAMPSVLPSEVQKQEESRPERAPSRPGSVPIPEWAMPLVHRIHAAGLPGLRWNLASADWLLVDALIKAKGVEAMADYAARAAGSATRPVVSARYFIPGWKELTNAPPPGTAAPPVAATPRRSTADERFAQAQALKAELFGDSQPPPLNLIRGELA